ncbi:hypothetical protein [Streptomyces sp. NPDC056387]|uniref:hypothetical protein n=1 Tax=Streptomyces sp. NPDC056387 TaxID=3345803 RepID=UPI0035D742C2
MTVDSINWSDSINSADPARLRAVIASLQSVLAERDEQIAYLIAAEPTLDDDQPGAAR